MTSHAPSRATRRLGACGSACHRLLGLLIGSALTGSGVDRAGSLTGSGVDRVGSNIRVGSLTGSGQNLGRVKNPGRAKTGSEMTSSWRHHPRHHDVSIYVIMTSASSN